MTLFALIAYFMVFDHAGISPLDLAFTDLNSYFTTSSSLNFVSRGNIFTPSQQTSILADAQTAYWVMLTGGQFFSVFMCKTRIVSIFTHGWFNNNSLNQGIFFKFIINLF